MTNDRETAKQILLKQLGDVDIVKTLWFIQRDTDKTVELLFFTVQNGAIRDCTNAIAMFCGFVVGNQWNSGILMDNSTEGHTSWCAEFVLDSLAEKLYNRRSQFDANLWKVRIA